MEASPLLLSSSSESSGRTAVVVRERDSVWLYLTTPDAQQMERDCWLFNAPGAPESPDLADYEDEAPPVPTKLTVGDAVRSYAADDDWELAWSDEGETVAVSLNGALLGVISSREETGYSTHLAEVCAWGRPLDEAALALLFPLELELE
jgi:hypothetical protein